MSLIWGIALRLEGLAPTQKGPGKPGPSCAIPALSLSDKRHAVIIVDGAGAGGVGPVPAVVVAVSRRAFQLAQGDTGAIAAERGIVFQRLPGQGIVVVADAKESAKAQDGVGH